MKEKFVFLPISLLDVFEALEDENSENILLLTGGELRRACDYKFDLRALPNDSFYKKVPYKDYKKECDYGEEPIETRTSSESIC